VRQNAAGIAILVGLLTIWGSALASTDAQREAVQRAHAQHVDAVEAARARQEAAEVSYKRMRHRNRIRGDEKAQVLAEREAAKQALAQAERDLEEFLDRARRNGVPPGWVRNNPQLSNAAAQ
jgi:hypothetical protein